MARKLTSKPETELEQETLEELIPRYASNKVELDSYKKLCDDDNAKIKQQMLEIGENEYSVGIYTAKRIVCNKEAMNEDRLIEVLKQHGITSAIKTKEYVDMNELENVLYNVDSNDGLFDAINSCRTTTQVIQLRITTKKAKKGDE